MPLMRQTSIAVISPLAAWVRMSTIWVSVNLVCFTAVSSLRGDTNTGAGTRIGGHPNGVRNGERRLRTVACGYYVQHRGHIVPKTRGKASHENACVQRHGSGARPRLDQALGA